MATANMTVADRLLQVLDHLGIERAHFAGRTPSRAQPTR